MTASRRPAAWPWRPLAAAVLAAVAVLAWRPARVAPIPPPSPPDAVAVVERLADTRAGRALAWRFPGALGEVAQAEVVGGPAAGRAVQWRLRGEALATAPDALLEQHAILQQAALARVLDAPEPLCGAWRDGTLDASAVLPAAWAQADEAFAVLLMTTPVRRDRPLRPGARHRALQRVLVALTPAQQDALARPGGGRLHCEAWHAFYSTAARLSPEARQEALRAALQAG